MHSARRDWLWMVVLPLVLHWPHLSGWLSENPAFVLSGLSTGAGAGQGVLSGYPGWIDGNAGVTVQALGGLAARGWLSGTVPWWNAYSGVGLPLGAELQHGGFLLPFSLLLGLFDGVVYLKIALQMVAGLSCLALLRALSVGRAASLLGAAWFALNGSFAWVGHGPMLPVAFAPLLLFGIERARTHGAQGAAWIAVAIAWSLLAGFPEVAYLDGLQALAFAGLRVGQDRSVKLAGWVGAGGIVGVLLAAPPLAAFVQSLPVSFVSNHADLRTTVLAPANRAALLLPYLFGPPQYGGLRLVGHASLLQFLHWFRMAPYLDLPLCVVAACAWPVARRAQVGLRWLLGLWVVAAMGRVLGLPGLAAAVNAVPLVGNTMACLYLVPSCQLALVLLAAMALDDWRTGRQARWVPSVAAATAGAVALLSLVGAWPAMAALRVIPGYGWFVALSVGGGIGMGAVLGWLMAGRCTPARWRLLGMLVVGEAALLCFVPLLCGTPRPRGIDQAAVVRLRALPLLARVQGVGVLSPNYGAWFGVAAIDHNYLPVPRNWVDDVRATLQPGMDGVNNFVPVANPPAMHALLERLPALAAHGVGFVLTPASAGFAQMVALPVTNQGNRPLMLTAPVTGLVAGRQVVAGELTGLMLMLGTYGGAARGLVRVRVCQEGSCAQAVHALATVTDNQDVPMVLDHALMVQAGMDVQYRIEASGGLPPAVWLWPLSEAAAGVEAVHANGSVMDGRAPRLVLRYGDPAEAPPLLWRDANFALYQVPSAAPYYVAPGCRLTGASRLGVLAACDHPAQLLRRELFYPGWRVWRDGQRALLAADGIYQSVVLPAGESRLRFAYAPPFDAVAWLGWMAGAVGLGLLGWLRWAGGSRMSIRAPCHDRPFDHAAE